MSHASSSAPAALPAGVDNPAHISAHSPRLGLTAHVASVGRSAGRAKELPPRREADFLIPFILRELREERTKRLNVDRRLTG